MPLDKSARKAIALAHRDAETVLKRRSLRRIEQLARPGARLPRRAPIEMQTAGVLVAEGDSWFDYPFTDVLSELEDRHGYDVESVASVRKALGLLKKIDPDVIVAEFNFQSDFRDRTSSLESLLAVVQRMPRTKVIVFYENEQAHQLAKLMARFPVHEALAYPIDARKLEESLRRIPR